MRVMALHAEQKDKPGACEIYRVNQPCYHLVKMKGWNVGWDTMRDLFAEFYFAAQQGQGAEAMHQFFSTLDVVVLPRTRVSEEAIEPFVEPFFEVCRNYGIKVVYEIDDDFTNEHRQVITGNYSAIAGRCDAITVTTPFLAKTMKDIFGVPTYVLPNMLDPELWRDGEVKRNLPSDKVLIWLAGSATHQQDWKVLENVFPALLQKHPHAVLVVCGFLPEYLCHLKGLNFLDGVDYRTYTQLVRQSDIVLAPVDPNDGFNMGKSPIKATEGQGAVRRIQNELCGAAVIATNNPVYQLTVNNGHDGLLVEHTPEAWFAALDQLLTDASLRHKLQVNAYKSVWKKGHWDISRQWTLWANAYRKIKAQPNRKNKQVAAVGEGVLS